MRPLLSWGLVIRSRSYPKNVNDFKADILVMGAHGHKGIKDMIFGTTVDKVRHRVNIPVFIVKDARVMS